MSNENKFDRAEQALEDGTIRVYDWEQFWQLPLMERVTQLSQGRFTFYLNGELVRPKDAVTRSS
jgi:hypothetical protein